MYTPDRTTSLRPPPRSSTASTSSLMAIDTVAPAEDVPEERTGLLDPEGGNEFYGSMTPTSAHKNLPPQSTFLKKLKYYIPSIAWIPNYSRSFLGGDLLAGMTVASMLIPQSVSYATSLAKLSPVTGLFSASIPGMMYALLGTSRQLNVAPEAALSLLLGQAVADIRHDYPDIRKGEPDFVGLGVATAITLQVGLISFLLGFFRLGFIDVVLSRALLRGFISAVAVVIMIEQFIPMLGLTKLLHQLDPETTVQKFMFLVKNALQYSNPLTATISFSALFALVALRVFKNKFKHIWWIYRVPEVLVVVIASTIMSAQFEWDKGGVDILGAVDVRTGNSFFEFPLRHSNLKFLQRTTSTSMIIAVVGFLDSIVSAKQNAARFGYSISPNRELVALGAANLAGSFIPGTLPAFGSITSIGLVVFSLLAETPHDVLFYWHMSAWVDITIMSLTFFLSIIYNIEIGVVGRIPGTDRWKPLKENPEAEETVPGALIIRIRESLDFDRLRRLELYGIDKSHPSEEPRREQASVLVFHMADVDSCDASAAQIFYELLEEYKSRNVGLFITHLRYRVEKTFKKAGIFDLLGADAFRDNVAEAMQIVESTRVVEPEPSFASNTFPALSDLSTPTTPFKNHKTSEHDSSAIIFLDQHHAFSRTTFSQFCTSGRRPFARRLDTSLLGALTIQVYNYHVAFAKDDRLFMKLMVYGIYVLDLLQTAFGSRYAWWVLASGWGNPWTLRFTPWTLGLVPVLTGLSEHSYLTAVGQCTAAMYSGIISDINLDVATRQNLEPPVTVWLALSTACDIAITIMLGSQLRKRIGLGFGTYNPRLQRAIRLLIETNLITTLVVIAELITFLQRATASWYFLFGMLIGKLYSNTLVATLNSRGSFTSTLNTEVHNSTVGHSTGVQVWKAASQREAHAGDDRDNESDAGRRDPSLERDLRGSSEEGTTVKEDRAREGNVGEGSGKEPSIKELKKQDV
ncbi:hypothetical protein D9619_002055 [Psilocybe cf. subviscida]|uniref:STAS domain-containing protein n=1 Tax=Psilocybe cf. subviscida TaxID=2480587 RepID=A0A8H5BCR7_9AGAR|nr:hypothetical protein D9619_002055 [Psilocybe cf. subviscida]